MNELKLARLIALAREEAEGVPLPPHYVLHVYEYGGGQHNGPGLALDLANTLTRQGRTHVVKYEALGTHSIRNEVHLMLYEHELGNPPVQP